jgi:hypothetical protein
VLLLNKIHPNWILNRLLSLSIADWCT